MCAHTHTQSNKGDTLTQWHICTLLVCIIIVNILCIPLLLSNFNTLLEWNTCFQSASSISATRLWSVPMEDFLKADMNFAMESDPLVCSFRSTRSTLFVGVNVGSIIISISSLSMRSLWTRYGKIPSKLMLLRNSGKCLEMMALVAVEEKRTHDFLHKTS